MCRAFPPLSLLAYSASLAVASPVLSHLTSAVSSNTVHTSAAVLLAASVLLYDYVSFSAENAGEYDASGAKCHRDNMGVDGGACYTPNVPVSTPMPSTNIGHDGVCSTSNVHVSAWVPSTNVRHNGVVSTSPSSSRITAWSASSLNSAMFAVVCLASRVDNAMDSFALLWAATAVLVVWTHARDRLITGLHRVTNGLIAAVMALALAGTLLTIRPALAVWYVVLTVLAWVVMPGVYVSLLPLKR